MISVDGVTIRFGAFVLFDRITFQVNAGDRIGTVTLAQLSSIAVQCQWKVCVGRCRQPQAMLQVNLPGRRVQQISAAYDLCDALVEIVNHNGQLIGR